MPAPSKRTSSTRVQVLIVLAAAVAARLIYLWYLGGVAAGIAAFGGDPLTAYGGSDVAGWLGAARAFRIDYWMFGVRPPLTPLAWNLVLRLGEYGPYRVSTLLAFQTVVGVLTVLAGFALARRLLKDAVGEGWILLGGVIMALDPASIVVSGSLLSEPLFNLMFVLLLLAIVACGQERRAYQLALAGLFLALAMLARATAVYFWILAPLIFAAFLKDWWKPALALALVGLTVYVGWSYRNLVYTGVFSYSLQTNWTLLFLRASSAEHLATGAPMDELYIDYVETIYERTGEEPPAEVGPLSFWDFHVAPSPEIYTAMGDLAREKLMHYWPQAAIRTPVGLWRMYATSKRLPAAFTLIELAYHVLLYGLAGLGAVVAVRKRHWEIAVTCLVPIVYVTGLTMVSQVSAMSTRMRSPLAAPLVILAVVGAAAVSRFFEARRGKLRSTQTGEQVDAA